MIHATGKMQRGIQVIAGKQLWPSTLQYSPLTQNFWQNIAIALQLK